MTIEYANVVSEPPIPHKLSVSLQHEGKRGQKKRKRLQFIGRGWGPKHGATSQDYQATIKSYILEGDGRLKTSSFQPTTFTSKRELSYICESIEAKQLICQKFGTTVQFI